MTHKRKIQVCITYIYIYIYYHPGGVWSQHLGRGKFHSQNPSDTKNPPGSKVSIQGLALAGGCKVTTKIGSKEDLIKERGVLVLHHPGKDRGCATPHVLCLL